MKLFNKIGIIAATSVLSLGFIQVNSAEAGSLNRDQFNDNAREFNFDGTSGIDVSDDNNLSVTNGAVLFIAPFDTNMSGDTYFDAGDESVIRLDFQQNVSALGMDYFTNSADNITLSVFNNSNALIEDLTLDSTKGFIGLDVGENIISYATIDTPLNGTELIIDNVIYQSKGLPNGIRAQVAVPEPASMLGILAVTGLGAASIKRKSAKAKEVQNA